MYKTIHRTIIVSFILLLLSACSSNNNDPLSNRSKESVYVKSYIDYKGNYHKGYVKFPVSKNKNAIKNNSKSHYYYETKGKYKKSKEYTQDVPLNNTLNNVTTTVIANLEIPKTNSKDKIITHTGYSLLYNETHEQASWVAYQLTREETTKLFERTDNFITDPEVKTGSANATDYKGSGYDRGHLAPASDMGWSAAAMAQSFYYSNMSPQTASFNRGIWKKLEELVRTWAIENNDLYIVTGPVLSSGLPTIGPNKVSIPNYYYKVILDYREPSIKGIGFILRNTGSKELLQHFAVSIDSVEKLTGIDFFPLLENDQESLIEKTLCINCWTWNNQKTNTDYNKNKTSESVTCNGITKAGNRCKNKTLNKSGYCYLHEGQSSGYNNNTVSIKSYSKPSTTSSSTAVQCSGITLSGNRCKRMTTNPSGRCYQH
ncbi:MAG: DNA/RNA non-specific endonuclease [Bacteroidota bacterium]